jgi:hypothetical protein
MSEVENPYRAAVAGKQETSWESRETIRHALTDLAGLLPLAWQSGSSGEVVQLVAELQAAAESTADDANEQFSDKILTEPEFVDENSWQAQ